MPTDRRSTRAQAVREFVQKYEKLGSKEPEASKFTIYVQRSPRQPSIVEQGASAARSAISPPTVPSVGPRPSPPPRLPSRMTSAFQSTTQRKSAANVGSAGTLGPGSYTFAGQWGDGVGHLVASSTRRARMRTSSR